jgi:hypothetical protein
MDDAIGKTPPQRRSASSIAAEAAFRERLAELGAELLEPYARSLSPHRVRCAAGHACRPRPAAVASGGGICKTCAGKDPAVAEAAFRARLADLGASPRFERYLGTNRPHPAICRNGHECHPRPNVIARGGGVCRTCSGFDPAVAEAKFRARLGELGAVPLFDEYRGQNRPHRVLCSAGHECRPRPSDVMRGHDVCRKCSHREWDAFYVVASPEGVKFGVTSGDPRRRLNDHAAKGYAEVVRLVTDLPGMVAHDTEIAIRSALETAGEKPARGREYFGRSCLALVLDVADSWLDSSTGLDIDGAAWRAECRKRARAKRAPVGLKTCKSCGGEFGATTARARYCSRRCINREAERRRTERLRAA